MKLFVIVLSLIVISFVSACDPQSGMTKKGLEKFNSSPTPEIKITPEPPIDPAEIVTVDVATQGPNININGPDGKKQIDCAKYNKVAINADRLKLDIKGVCKQLMINGDKNEINGVAFTEIVINGSDNKVGYSKYANGKRPIIADNTSGNTVEKTVAPEKPDANVKK